MKPVLKSISNEKDYEAALKEMERLWGAKLSTPEGDRLDALATQIDAYEEAHHSMDRQTQTIKFRAEQQR